jgi:hypothetical protein
VTKLNTTAAIGERIKQCNERVRALYRFRLICPQNGSKKTDEVHESREVHEAKKDKAQQLRQALWIDLEPLRDALYREAVTPQSPGLLQPWDKSAFITNPERVATVAATALRLNQ